MREVAIFETTPEGSTVLIGRTEDPDILKIVAERLAADRRRELAQLERPVRLVPGPEGGGADA